MHVIDLIQEKAESGEKFFSLEFFPPKTKVRCFLSKSQFGVRDL
jgi:5,10-methylenetetrahydrofolate reductase